MPPLSANHDRQKKSCHPRNPTEDFLMHYTLDSIFINCSFMGVKGLRQLLVGLRRPSLPHPLLCLHTLAGFWCRASWPFGFVGHRQFLGVGQRALYIHPNILFRYFALDKDRFICLIFKWNIFLFCRRGQRWLIKHCFKLLKVIPSPH